MEKNSREFIAIEIPEKIKEEIKKIQEKMPEFKGKLTERQNLHLTLKFLGEIDKDISSMARKKLKNIKARSFESEIKGIGTFPERVIRIIWIKMTNCESLQEEIDEKFSGLFEKERRFMGHITIARVKGIKDERVFWEELKKIKMPEDLKFKVNNFELKKSKLTKKGPIYETIESYGLE